LHQALRSGCTPLPTSPLGFVPSTTYWSRQSSPAALRLNFGALELTDLIPFRICYPPHATGRRCGH
jgi:hypothetical protein